jgi:hypothetical protein
LNFGFSLVGEGGDPTTTALLLPFVSFFELSLRCVGGSFSGGVALAVDLEVSEIMAAVVSEDKFEVLTGRVLAERLDCGVGMSLRGRDGAISVAVTLLASVAAMLVGLAEPFCC